MNEIKGAETFEVKNEHLELMKRAFVGWEHCGYGAPSIDCKRPYGNSDVEGDIAEIFGWEYDEEEGLTEEQSTKALHIPSNRLLEFTVNDEHQAYSVKDRQISALADIILDFYMEEDVVFSAIKVEGVGEPWDGVYTGLRHPDCFMAMRERREAVLGSHMHTTKARNEVRVAMVRNSTQGFITTRNRFIDRKEAYEMAKEQGQLWFHKLPFLTDELTSEDLY